MLEATLASQPRVDIQPIVCEFVALNQTNDARTRCVAEEFLMFRRSEFTHPMVLPSTSWCPGEACVRRESHDCMEKQGSLGPRNAQRSLSGIRDFLVMTEI